DTGSSEQRNAVLNALARRERYDTRPLEDVWRPLVSKAASSPEPRLRRTAATLIGMLSPTLAADMVGPLLVDEDADASNTAAEVVLGILAGRKSGALRGLVSAGFEFDNEVVIQQGGRPMPAKTNTPIATAERLALWH